MDPVSQACLGASLSQSFAGDRAKQLSALLVGALAGMAPDLDIFIQDSDDPLLFLEFHRQFTHSLIFIPFGALLCALFFYPLARFKLSFKQIYVFSLSGIATHGLLDACTSYGTQLYWPFSNERVAWNLVSIIDPFFTLPILLLILIAVVQKKPVYARISFIYALLFLSAGLIQKNRAQESVYNLAKQRGHVTERVQVKPSFANRHVWKTIYEYDGRYYVDAVKLLWETEQFAGMSIEKLDIKRDFPWLRRESQQAKDIERFRWFSDDFLAPGNETPYSIIDIRYSFLPNRIEPMWSIILNEQNKGHVKYKMKSRPDRETVNQFIEMLF